MPKSPLEMAELEHKMLRVELHDLKECQIKFLSSAVIAAGLLLGIPKALQESKGATDPYKMVYLVPLVVLIPCWWGFFAKAKTITRIVGYFRVPEGMLLGYFEIRDFLGWERSLARFRQANQEGRINKPPRAGTIEWARRIGSGLLLLPSQRYWLLAEWTYAILSLVSVGFPIWTVYRSNGYPWQFWFANAAVVLVLYTFIANVWILGALWWSQHSYNWNFEVWCGLLSVVEARTGHELGTSAVRPAMPAVRNP